MIKEKLTLIKSKIEAFGFGELLENNIKEWVRISNAIPFLPLQYKANFINFQKAYFQEQVQEYIDISFVIKRGGKSVGIWPFCIYEVNSAVHIGSVGREVVPPLLIEEYGSTEKKRALFEKCLLFIKEILDIFELREFNTIDTVMNDGVSLWCKKIMENGGICTDVRHQLYYDLLFPIEKAKIRRTNKYSIEKGYNLFNTTIVTRNSTDLDECFEKFRQLHVRTAGRETRSLVTWGIQKEGLQTSNDFLVMLSDKKTGELNGAALFVTTDSVGLYAVAAYNRDLFDKPVGHVAQAVAIGYMRDIGLRWYEIGERTYINDKDATDKLVSIGHYKEGFATNTFLKIIIHLKYKG